jgi:hypothetical protein
MTLRRDPFTAGLGDLQGPTHWASLLPDEARQSWAELRDWVEHLVDRFALETRVVPPCWYRHNTLVESLSAPGARIRARGRPSSRPTPPTASSGSSTKASPTAKRRDLIVYPPTGNRYRTRAPRHEGQPAMHPEHKTNIGQANSGDRIQP